MPYEQTLAIIKPDGVMKGVVDQIKERYIHAGLSIVFEATLTLDESQVRDFYRDHEGKFYFEGLVLSMTSGPCVVLILGGEYAIRKVRQLNGATNPAEAARGSIRHDFRSAGGPFNTVHASDSTSAFVHETKVVLDKAR